MEETLKGRPIRKRPLGRPRYRWEEDVTMHLKEIGVNTRNCVDSTENNYYWRALVNSSLDVGFHKPWS